MVHIQLLGSFSGKIGDQDLAQINSPRMQSLLAYLLIHRGVPQPRQQVASLLWPETSEAQARTNLRNLLHRLKHTFPSIDAYIHEDHGALQWISDVPFHLDIADFELAVAEAKRDAGAGDQPAEQAALERAARLYSGDLLPGCYDDWILPYREELHQAHLNVLERLAELLEAQQQYREAIIFAQRSLRSDPLNEAIYRQLMRLHRQLGDRTGGMRVYNTCVAVLDQELGVLPSAATRETYQRLLEEGSSPAPAPAQPTPRKAKNNLPYALTNFIGREREIQEVVQLLSANRLLTVTGSPGAGKTRFGLQVAAQLSTPDGIFPDGVWWIDLSAASDLPDVAQAAAAALGIREKQGQSLLQTIIEALQERSLLLALDNAEHIMEAVSTFSSAMLRACPNLRMLITSREALGTMGEVAWAISPLSFPKQEPITAGADRGVDPETIIQYESVLLFVDRAAATLPTFRLNARNAAAVGQICARLEGIPLAIELAAARVKMMTVEQIAARMEEALRLLRANRGSGLSRHQTLEAAIEWSYQLLSEPEKLLFRRLAVFAGGFTLEAAEPVAACRGPANAPGGIQSADVMDLLSRLIDKSLVKVMEGEQAVEVRYSLLEMIRQYAQERLEEAGEQDEIQKCHAAYCISLVEEADSQVRGPNQAAWLNRLEMEHENMRKALRWAVANRDEEAGLRLANSLWQFWDIRGHLKEGRQWFRSVLEMGSSRTALLAKAFKGAGGLAWSQSDYAEARERMAASLEIYRELGEKRDVAVGLFNLGLVTYSPGDYADAVPILEESLALFKELNHRQGIANALNSLGVVASALGDYTRARLLYEESLTIRKELGDQRGLAIVDGNLGVVALRQGDYQNAEHFMKESLRLYQEIGDKRGCATSLNELGQLAHQQGRQQLACQQYHHAISMWQELDSSEGLAGSLEGIAAVAGGMDAEEQAVRLLAFAASLREASQAPHTPADAKEYERTVSALHERMTEDAFARSWNQGHSMTLEQALETARQFV